MMFTDKVNKAQQKTAISEHLNTLNIASLAKKQIQAKRDAMEAKYELDKACRIIMKSKGITATKLKDMTLYSQSQCYKFLAGHALPEEIVRFCLEIE